MENAEAEEASSTSKVDDNASEPSDSDSPITKRNKEKTPGIIYLSTIPDGMQYGDIYRVFSELGQVGRISLNGARKFMITNNICNNYIIIQVGSNTVIGSCLLFTKTNCCLQRHKISVDECLEKAGWSF